MTAAELAHVHQALKHNLSYDSSADVAQTQRTLGGSLWLFVIGKRYQVEGPKQKQFSGAEGEYIEVK